MSVNSYCKNLSNAVRLHSIQDQLYFEPCCWVPNLKQPVSNKNELTIARKNVVDIVMSAPKKHCGECYRKENMNIDGQRSERQRSNSRVSDDAVYGNSHILEIQIDTTCNAACVICNSGFSSLWRRQDNQKNPEVDVTHAYNKLYNLVDFDTIEVITFLGGEPLLLDHNQRLIERIPDPSRVGLHYITNGSIFPNDQLQELWSKFKYVKMVFSIDGIKNRFEYLRWPLQWNKVERNFQHFLENTNFRMGINVTLNPLNIWYADEIENWVNELNNGQRATINWSPCDHGPLQLTACPEALRDAVRHKFTNNHPVAATLNGSEFKNSQYHQMLDFISPLDIKRKNNWRETFADVQHYFC